MIPEQFDYVAAKTLEEAVALLAKGPDDARVLAGGHSLIPAMKLRIAQPPALVDIGRIKELSYIREEGGQIRIGAATTHYQIESSARLAEICPLLPETASNIGDVQVRNRGTVGGSLAHCDPAADWPAAMLALDAEMVAVGAGGERVIKAEDFFVGLLTSALEPGEILREIRVPLPQGKVGQAYKKMPQSASGFAVVGVAVNVALDSNGICQSARVGVTGVSGKAYRAHGVEAKLLGGPLTKDRIQAAAALATDGVDVNSDLSASEDYRRNLAVVYTARALTAANSAAA
ncbi:MAG TPA: xanthine dehydrogenase family protein subunit M [Blastocatellia bacterium]|nr:xanthine dehydrogenase family protein subunit M [Blastocatellia bacterium]